MRYSKYGAKKVVIDGVKFDSQAEAKHYLYTLKPKLEAGEISNLEFHPRFRCEIRGIKICDYLGDFRYTVPANSDQPENSSTTVIEDVKGTKTDVYRIKKKLVEALYPEIKITEIDSKIYRSKKYFLP